LEKAKYVERSVTEIKSVLPQGRLNTRVAIQNQALKSKGVFEQMPAWRANKRKHTDDPTLKIGVMVDISGSMGSAMEAMATTAWVLSEAGRRVQAKTAMVYYGSDVFATLKVGQHLDQVSVWSAPDGTEKFGRAFDALDGTLDLVYGQGVRMLVIVSDGHYSGEETQKAKNAIKMCADNGVAVLWVTPKECYSGMGERLVGKNGVVLDGMDTNQIALAIGRSATDALNKVSGGM
jgi:Mg-chelatase subunit ChlD